MRLVTFLLLIFAMDARSQTAEDSVRSAVAGIFKAMYDADAAGLRSHVSDTARMETLSTKPDGVVVLGRSTAASWIESVGRQKKGVLDERAETRSVMVDGPMAMAWVPYRFYYQGAFSHCGVNVMLFARGREGWKLVSVTDTRRKDACPN
jgi:hypothetical protein